jgi:NADH-ubiquinone oxidoreductase chain 5
LWGPYGLSLLLSKIGFYISKLDTGIVTSYSLYMFIGLQIYCVIIYFLMILLVIPE